MNIPGPSNPPTNSIDSCISPSPFGFPEKDVINFINGCKLGPDDARDFMLFLTYSNQISQATNGSSVDLTYATSLIKIINQLNKGSSDTALETNCTVAPSIIQSENVLTVSHSFAKNSPPRVPVNRHLKGFKPTIGKHNDAKFYPNIICVICKEWVCSRSRRIHIGAHFGYRKYVCSTCGFSHTKEIFVETHIRKCHNRLGFVIQKDDPSMECRIEDVCNDSIAMTRDVLSGRYDEGTYASYANINTDRSQIANKERRSRTQVLSAVTDTSNRQIPS
ncbi:hypothetical protein Y032_0065g3664 [Ancylostoma ceylanicum]|nr:hypothetical protein Y032_0065g3664 [Ancylostoma ceylanicum]